MKNWTMDELIKYENYLYEKLDEIKHKKKWYHSRKTKQYINNVKNILLSELCNVNKELTIRGIRI